MSYREIDRGGKGEDITHLQSPLNRLGAMRLPDGDFGSGTERGVRCAQDVANQPVTGTKEETGGLA